MTAYELHFLVSEQTNTIFAAFEIWVGVTAVVFIAAHYGGKNWLMASKNRRGSLRVFRSQQFHYSTS